MGSISFYCSVVVLLICFINQSECTFGAFVCWKRALAWLQARTVFTTRFRRSREPNAGSNQRIYSLNVLLDSRISTGDFPGTFF